MFETEAAKKQPAVTKDVPTDTPITNIKVKYDEFPDRNQYIHGLCFEGTENAAEDDGFGRRRGGG